MSSDSPVRKLVLLPGMDGTGTLFAPFIEALPHGFEAVPVSYPNDRPLSYSELAEFVTAQLPLRVQFVLLAESFSTPLAVQIAADQPTGLRALILVAGFVTNPSYAWVRRVAPLIKAPPGLVRFSGPVIRRFLVGPDAPDSLVDATKQAAQSADPGVLASRLKMVLGCDARSSLGRITVPILYLQATRDRIVPARCLDEILAIRPDVAVVRIDGPHLLLQREPERAAGIVTNLIKQLT
jgi:pimeloyl-[acyl-carrier protein] methyl ester esterase